MSKRIENDLDGLFVEWKSKMKEQDSTSHFTRDGLMYNKKPIGQNEEAWFSLRNRILFLLKDQNQDGAEKWDEDIREWLIDTEKDTAKHHKTKEANRNLAPPFYGISLSSFGDCQKQTKIIHGGMAKWRSTLMK